MAEQARVKLKNCSIPGVGLPGSEVTIDAGHAKYLVEVGNAEYVVEEKETDEEPNAKEEAPAEGKKGRGKKK